MFYSDYPRGLTNCLWSCWFPAFDPFPVAPALAIAFLLACRRRPVSLLRLPQRPFSRRFSTALAAIPLLRLPRMELLLAPFEQTTPLPWPACPVFPPPSRLIFDTVC